MGELQTSLARRARAGISCRVGLASLPVAVVVPAVYRQTLYDGFYIILVDILAMKLQVKVKASEDHAFHGLFDTVMAYYSASTEAPDVEHCDRRKISADRYHPCGLSYAVSVSATASSSSAFVNSAQMSRQKP